MPTTSNFGWTTPADTDLVKDGAAAIRTLGNGIDTSFLDLKGGTTGQNLRKASNTDLDFTFAGDATNTVIDAEGDLLVGDSADTLQKLAIGTTGQVLTVDTTLDGKIKWAAPASGGKVLQVVSATYAVSTSTSTQNTDTDTGLSVAITPSAATSKVLVIVTQNAGVARAGSNLSIAWKLLRGASVVYTNDRVLVYVQSGNADSKELIGVAAIAYLDSPSTTSSTTYKTQMRLIDPGTVTAQVNGSTSSIIALEIGA